MTLHARARELNEVCLVRALISGSIMMLLNAINAPKARCVPFG